MRRLVLAGLIAITACSDATGTTSTAPTADGTWNAAIAPPSGGSGTMALTLTQTGSTINGNGTFTDPADPPPAIMTVTGSVSGTAVTLTLQVQPQQYNGQTIDQNKAPVQFTGTLTATTMNGTLSGGDVGSATANFTKQ